LSIQDPVAFQFFEKPGGIGHGTGYRDFKKLKGDACPKSSYHHRGTEDTEKSFCLSGDTDKQKGSATMG